MSSFFNIVHVSISERGLPASICCYLVQNIKHQNENGTNHHAHVNQRKKRRKSQHTSEKNPMCSNNFQTPTTLSIISRRITSLESQQKIISVKVFFCHHSNNLRSRTLDLCSLLLCEYCSTQASFARASASCHPLPPIPPITNTHTGTHSHKKAHNTRFSLTRNCVDIHSQKSAHYMTHIVQV